MAGKVKGGEILQCCRNTTSATVTHKTLQATHEDDDQERYATVLGSNHGQPTSLQPHQVFLIFFLNELRHLRGFQVLTKVELLL